MRTKSGWYCSPRLRLTGTTRCASSASSRKRRTLSPFGVGEKWKSIMAVLSEPADTLPRYGVEWTVTRSRNDDFYGSSFRVSDRAAGARFANAPPRFARPAPRGDSGWPAEAGPPAAFDAKARRCVPRFAQYGGRRVRPPARRRLRRRQARLGSLRRERTAAPRRAGPGAG